jgi:hypothetical protein
MKKILIVIFLFVFIYRNTAQTPIGGVFFNDTTLTLGKSPYHVTSDVLVPIGVSVKVEPGVVFYFDSNISWTVEGEFQAIGNRHDSIKFLLQPGSSPTWKGITYNPSAVSYNAVNRTGCILDYCVISQSGSTWITSATVFILHSEIKNCTQGIMAYGSGDVIKHTHIHDCFGQVFSTYYGYLFPLPVIMDSCEINNINGYPSDALRLTSNAIFSNNCVHDITADFALSIFEGPNIQVVNNNFYNNNAAAIVLIDGPDASVNISNNNFTNNTINISKSECYSTPVITRNNFFSYKNYNIYCTSTFALGGPVCRAIPNGSFYTLDMKQNYFAHHSSTELDSSVYDLYDNWIGRTIIAYDATIVTPYHNNLNCAAIFDSTLSVINSHPVEHSLSLYPNPFNDKLNILSNTNGNFELILYDLLSQKIVQRQFTNSMTLSTEELAKGVYIYEVRNKKGVIQNGKVVKE